MLIEQTREELHAAQPIHSQCTLTQVVLAKSSFTAFGDEEIFQVPLRLTFKHDVSGALNDRTLMVLAHFDFKCMDASDVTAFDLSCTFKLTYELTEGCNPTEQQIDAFKKGNAVYNCWPYVREFVQNITSRMGFQPPPLPLLRVNVKKDVPPAPQSDAVPATEVKA